MSIRVIEADGVPGHSGPVPQSVRAGDWLYVSALFGTDQATDDAPADIVAEAGLLLDHLELILAAAGADLSRVVRAGLYFKDLQADRPAFNTVWAQRFGDHRPARSAVGVNDFGRPGTSFRVMLDAVAHLGE